MPSDDTAGSTTSGPQGTKPPDELIVRGPKDDDGKREGGLSAESSEKVGDAKDPFKSGQGKTGAGEKK